MLEREVERGSKLYPLRREGKTYGKTKWIRICRRMDSGRERKHWACLGVVEAKQPIEQWALLRGYSQQAKIIDTQQGRKRKIT